MIMENKTLFSTIPKLNQLKHFLVIIDFAEIEEVTFLNVFNKQKILARRLIESRDDILAAPVKGQISHIHLIISEDSYERNELEATLDSLKLILNGPFFLPHIVYLRAIHFTLNVKLSDEWNEVQNYFVKSDKFLKTKEILQSVRVHLFITDASLGVCAYGLRLKLPEMSLSDLGVDIDKFYSTGFAETKKTVYTLPDFKSATALGVYMNLPNIGPFKEYSDLRNYWKIVYGYPLPENEEGMVYVDVTFGWNNITYIYPIICLFPYEPLPFKSKMPFESIYGFLETVERKFPKICGHPLNIRSKMDTLPYNTYLPGIPRMTPLTQTLDQTFVCCQKRNDILENRSQPFKKFKPNPTTILGRNRNSTLQRNDFHTYSEMKTSALLKNLNVYTMPILKNFCNENNIPIVSKEKKDVLIKKIYDFFGVL